MDKENESMDTSQNEKSTEENAYPRNDKVFRLKKLSCPSCGGTVEITEGQDIATCPYCHKEFSIGKESLDFTIDRDVLIKYNGESPEVEVPSSVKAIEISAFYQQNTLTKIVLPEGVTLRMAVFNGCMNLETVVLPDSLESIPPNTFDGCVSLKSIELPKNVKEIGRLAFSYCEKLTSIEIPPKVESVPKNAFMRCDNLETIICYDDTKFIGEYEGDNFICEKLSSIKVLDSKTGDLISTKRLVDDEYGMSKVLEDESNV